MVNRTSKDTQIKNSEVWYNDAKENGYLVKSDKVNSWWKGKGGFLDYTNPEGNSACEVQKNQVDK